MSEKEYISRYNLVKRNIFIKKRFQADFAWKFLVLIVLESLLAIGLFVYLSKGTIITGFTGSEVIVAKTGEYFLPTLLLTNLVVIGLTAVSGFVVMLLVSHKIAGPLWRFERSLEETSSGDLTNRFNLRTDDQMHELASRMNEFNSRMDEAVSEIQRGLKELTEGLRDIEKELVGDSIDNKKLGELLTRATTKLEGLERAAGYFTTSYSSGKEK